MFALLLAAAWAGPVAVDAEAATGLGMPRLHEPFVDCQCVGMTWETATGTVTLEVPVAEVARLERVVADGPHELALVTAAGHRIVLEEAPCVYAASIGTRYTDVLGLPVTVVDDQGAEVVGACADGLAEVREWSERMAKLEKDAVHYMTTADLGVAELEVLSSKGEEGLLTSARRALAATRTSAGRCLGRVEEGVEPPAIQVTVKGSAAATRVKARPTGAPEVDACMDDLVGAMALPSGKMKLKAVYSAPRS